ncbi:tetratricopeptide repeat protein [Futiania mangrovi]|uniref:Tetratricopeptide repeat protein n=1 Tax=Futiania mangrovi TaxID=2959716 RepID=A0A9J6PHP1_9PROT|nr:tetratricopeptide repeat protein [Futiania mangrovii]MCP1337323.1 tetratricopeptide repeat protein [Futiania mangrovii]
MKRTDRPETPEKARESVRDSARAARALLKEALAHREAGRRLEAERTFRRAVETAPKDEWAWALYGAFLQEVAGRLDDAHAAYSRALAIDPDFDWVRDRLEALIAGDRGSEDAEGPAGQHGTRGLTDPAGAPRRPAGGDTGLDTADFATHPAAERAADARRLEQAGRHEDAREAWSEVVELEPDNVTALCDLANLCLYPLDHPDEALDAAERALELDDTCAEAHGLYGRALWRVGGDAHAALAAIERAIALDGTDCNAHAWRGQILHESLDEAQAAESAYLRALELAPDFSWVREQLALLYKSQLDRPQDAARLFRALLKEHPDDTWAAFELAELLHDPLGASAEAERLYRRVAAANPNTALPLIRLAELLMDGEGQAAEAEALLSRAIALEPRNREAVLQLAELLAASEGRASDAERLLRRHLAHTPRDADARLLLADLIGARGGRLAEAEALYREVLKREPRNAHAWRRFGRFWLDRAGDTDAAEAAFLTARSLDPDEAAEEAPAGLQRVDEPVATASGGTPPVHGGQTGRLERSASAEAPGVQRVRTQAAREPVSGTAVVRFLDRHAISLLLLGVIILVVAVNAARVLGN